MDKKYLFYVLGAIVILSLGYYLISPLFISSELNEKSPLAGSAGQMDEATKAEFDKQVEEASRKLPRWMTI